MPLATAFLAAAALSATLALLARPTTAQDAVEPYVWLGNVTDTGFSVHLSSTGADADADAALQVWSAGGARADADDVAARPPATGVYAAVRAYDVGGLAPGRRYAFAVRGGEELGSVATFPRPGETAAEVFFALTSCQKRAAASNVWEDMAARLPAASEDRAVLVMHAGDLHYENIGEDNPERFRDATLAVVRDERAHKVFSQYQVSYMYDDHDSGKNNAGGDSPSRPAALGNYAAMVPHTPVNLSKADEPRSFHAFTAASVRFVLTDLRTQSSAAKGEMMGDEQLGWLLSELRNSSSYSVVVWLSSRPWIAEEMSGADHWGGISPGQRRTIANVIAQEGVDNLILVSGDMHALAADDGTHSDYSERGSAGFPVLHAGPAANAGSAKGGPYSEGCVSTKFALNKQYATVRLYNLGAGGSGKGPCVDFNGYQAGKDDAVLSFQKCAPLGGVKGVSGGGQGPKCAIGLLPTWGWVVVGFAAVFLLLASVLGVGYCWRRCRKRKPSN